jgi:multisubunit Na+/H+ antiporter MnhB subunit
MNRKVSLSAINEWLWQTTNRPEVMKDLSDTRWDWLRTPRGLTAVIAVSFFVLFVAPVIVWFVDDGIGFAPLVMVAGVFVAWFLLRRAVRLVADAPDDALDERLIEIRNRTYLSAYRAIAGVLGLIATVLLFWSIVEIRAGSPAATFSLTWPQANALVWFVFAQIMLMPSLTLAVGLRRRKVQL